MNVLDWTVQKGRFHGNWRVMRTGDILGRQKLMLNRLHWNTYRDVGFNYAQCLLDPLHAICTWQCAMSLCPTALQSGPCFIYPEGNVYEVVMRPFGHR